MFRKFKAIIFTFLELCIFFARVGSSHAELSTRLDSTWTQDKFWDSSRAEILIFRAREMRYGIPRETEAVHVLVKEDHLPSLQVKSENWKLPGLIPRLKFNNIITVPTGIYTYRQMVSVFFNRADMKSDKTVFTSQEWCGQTYKELTVMGPSARLEFNSYWDGEGRGTKTISLPADVIEYNALPVLLRAFHPEKEGDEKVSMFPDLISSKVGNPQILSATLKFKGLTKTNVEGKSVSANYVEVSWTEAKKSQMDKFWFSPEGLKPMIRHERWDGAIYELRKRLEDDYWHHNHPGDEQLLK